MKRVYLLLLFSVIFVACSKDNPAVDQQPAEAYGVDKIYASVGDVETRVQLNGDFKTVWNTDDEITIFGPKEYSQWTFDGKTGDRSGSFSRLQTFEPMLEKVDKFYALYPGHGHLDYSTTTAANSELITAIQPVQTYVEGSYCPKSNVMLGSSEDGSAYYFKNLVAYLRLSLTGSKTVKRIDVMGNDNELLAGKLYVNCENSSVSFRWDDVETSQTISLDCGDGVQLSETPQDFYIVMPPMSFSHGITICVTFTDGSVFPRSTSKYIDLQQNNIKPMAVVETDFDDWQNIYIYHSGNRVAMPQLTGASSMSGCIIWGDDNISVLGGDTDYRYADGQQEHTISVQIDGANTLQLNSCTGISRIDFSNF